MFSPGCAGFVFVLGVVFCAVVLFCWGGRGGVCVCVCLFFVMGVFWGGGGGVSTFGKPPAVRKLLNEQTLSH